jgi:hypothetical protein
MIINIQYLIEINIKLYQRIESTNKENSMQNNHKYNVKSVKYIIIRIKYKIY